MICMICHSVTMPFPLEAVTARLEARGVGGEGTGIVEAVRFVRDPCPRCGGLRFGTAPAWPSRES